MLDKKTIAIIILIFIILLAAAFYSAFQLGYRQAEKDYYARKEMPVVYKDEFNKTKVTALNVPAYAENYCLNVLKQLNEQNKQESEGEGK